MTQHSYHSQMKSALKLISTMLFELFFVQAILFSFCQSIDLTTVPETSGIDVVFASVSRIQLANIFPDDNRLLRRVAFAETRDGIDLDTYR